MACTCVTCGTGLLNGCCPTCQPAQPIFRGECQDPGTLTIGRFLSVLDYKFCEHRLATGTGGFLVSNINGSGNAGFTWTTTPQVQLMDYQAVEDTAFGQLVVMGSDYRWRALAGPASLGLFLQTDGSGNVFFGDPPAAVVPDPLAINDLNVANDATLNNVTAGGTLTLNNLATGTVANLLGLNASNEVVLQAIAGGIAGSMFFESPTSPNSSQPNLSKVSGDYLVIGNRLFDSGANLISVSTSEALTVQVAGTYLLAWVAQIHNTLASTTGIWLEINGVIVNQGTGRTSTTPATATAADKNFYQHIGLEMRNLAANDVLKLQLSKVGGGVVSTFEVRLIAIKLADA